MQRAMIGNRGTVKKHGLDGYEDIWLLMPTMVAMNDLLQKMPKFEKELVVFSGKNGETIVIDSGAERGLCFARQIFKWMITIGSALVFFVSMLISFGGWKFLENMDISIPLPFGFFCLIVAAVNATWGKFGKLAKKLKGENQ